MSDTNLKRIKEIRQREDSGYSNPIPLGSEGQYIDMKSNLDLEEQLKLGGNHRVVITENFEETVIKEYYFHNEEDSQQENTVENDYIVITKIQNNYKPKFGIIVAYNNNQEVLLGISSDSQDIVYFLGQGTGQEHITTEMKYPNQQNIQGQYIHKKEINFLNNSNLILEEVDKI